MTLQDRIKSTIREVPNFPRPGIVFKDITPLLHDVKLSNEIAETLAGHFKEHKVNALVGVESRGFLFGMLLAHKLHVPFITVRKAGRLPYKTIAHKYDLEYGSETMEMHIDAIQPGWKILIHDDLLATGGTAAAAAELVQMQNAQVAGFAFVVALNHRQGKQKLNNYSSNVLSLVEYE